MNAEVTIPWYFCLAMLLTLFIFKITILSTLSTESMFLMGKNTTNFQDSRSFKNEIQSKLLTNHRNISFSFLSIQSFFTLGLSEGCCTSKDECVVTEGESKYCRPCSEKVTTTQHPRYIHTEDHDPTIDVTMEPSVHDEQPVTNESGSKTSSFPPYVGITIVLVVIIIISIIYFLGLFFRKSHEMQAPPMSSYP